jgi:hypothetical protein
MPIYGYGIPATDSRQQKNLGDPKPDFFKTLNFITFFYNKIKYVNIFM